MRPMGIALGMATMLFPDEILAARAPRRDRRGAPKVKTTERELEIAEQLIDSLAGDFEPEKYRDTYREQVLALIERKAEGEEIAVQPAPEEVMEPAPDLMSALKASLDAVRAAGERRRRGERSRPSEKPPPRSPPPRNPPPRAAAPREPAAKR